MAAEKNPFLDPNYGLEPEQKAAANPFLDPNYGKETDGTLARGFNKAGQSMKMTAQLAGGDTEGVAQTVKDAADYAQANPSRPEGQKLMEAWDKGDGVLGGIGNVARQVKSDYDEAKGFIPGMKAVGRDLRAMGEGIVEQVPNMIAPTVGMVGGAAAGSAAGGPAGAVAGGWVGASAGNALVEGGDQIQTAIQKAGIDPRDTAAVRAYLYANGDQLLKQTAIKGGVIGAVDTATAGLAHFLLTGPGKAAAGRALSEMGVDVADKAAVKTATQSDEFAKIIANDAAYQASKQGVGNVARNATAAGLEPAGEFAGEYLGQGLASGDWDTKNAALEALSSVGQSGAMFAGQKAWQYATSPAQAKADPADTQDAPLLALPAPTYTGTPNDQMLQAEAERANAVAEAEARAAGIYQQRDEFDATREANQVGAPIPFDRTPAEELAAQRKAAMGIDPAAGPLSAGAAIAVESQAAEDVRLGAASVLAEGAARAQQAQAERAAWEEANPGIPYEPVQPTNQKVEATPEAKQKPSGSFGAMSEFADLLNQERQDAAQRRAGIADVQGQRREFEMAEADRRTEESMQREAQARRRAVLDAVLADPETKNPAGRFAATLRREGYRDSTPTADELKTIQRFEDVRAAQPAPPEIEPSAPNEMDAAAMGIRERRPKVKQEAPPPAKTTKPSAVPSQNPGDTWAGMDASQRADVVGRLQGVPPIVSKNVPRSEWGKINPALQGKLAEAMQTSAASPQAPNTSGQAPNITAAAPNIPQENQDGQRIEQQAGAEMAPQGGTQGRIDVAGSAGDLVQRPDGAAGTGMGAASAGPVRGGAPVEPAGAATAGRDAVGQAAPFRPKNLVQLVREAGGVSIDRKADINQDSRTVGVFRKGGMDLDGLAELLQQNGFMTDADVTDTTSGAERAAELLRAALDGERVLSMNDVDEAMGRDAEAQYREEIRRKAAEYGIRTTFRPFGDVERDVLARDGDLAPEDASAYDYADGGVLAESLDLLDDINLDDTPALSEEGQMRALGFTEEEVNEAINRAGPAEVQGQPEQAQPRAAQEGGRRGAEEDPGTQGGLLESYSQRDLATRDEAQRLADEARAKAERDADRKAQADADRDTFTLTGSDRAADVMAAQGQEGLFDAPAARNQEPIKNEAPASARVPGGAASAEQSSIKNERAPAPNTIFTEDAAAKAREILRKKLGQLNSGLDPEMLQAGITLAGYHIEKGARSFSAYAQAMLADLGDAVRPYLKSWYMGVKYDPRAAGFDGMDAAAVVEAADPNTITTEVQDAPSTDGGVERNRQEPAPERAVGNAVQDGPRGTGSGNRNDGGRAGREGGSRQPDGARVSADRAATGGERSDQRLPGGNPAVVLADVATGAEFGERGSDIGLNGISSDPIPASQVEKSAGAGAPFVPLIAQQRAAESVKVVPGSLENIRATLPYLLPGQQEDVLKAEQRFSKPDGYGMLFTNGTGTGKTFSGLGVVKRLQRQGKTNTLIVVPDDKIAADWIESGVSLGLSITKLKDTKGAGRGIVIATYANLGENDQLATREWDLVVADEAHTLMQSADGRETTYLSNLRAITLHPDGAFQRHTMLFRDDINALRDLTAKITSNAKIMNGDDATDSVVSALREENAKLEAEARKLSDKISKTTADVRAYVAEHQGTARPRLVALSATPFAYEKTVDWANGYLFDYHEGRGNEAQESRGYNVGSNREQFFMQHFGYTMRYNKLTEPDGSKVDRGLLQRQFNGWLKKSGSLSSRTLDVAADYDRRFVLVDSAIGNRIDDALGWLSDSARNAEKGNLGFFVLRDAISEKFDYLSRRYLLEAIKATEAVPIVKEHLRLGRKVVVFHDYKKGGGFNPFRLEPAAEAPGMDAEALQSAQQYNAALRQFNEKFSDLVNTQLGALPSPIEVFKREFPDVLLINGDEKKADLLKRYKLFQDDASGPVVMLVQSAKNKGWSGHDTTGKHQRVLINLGQPTAPTLAIQQEGRIYRTGQVSNAIMRYLNTGTNWEKWAFATTIATRASAAENLGMGELSRALKDSFVSAFEESDAYPPGHEGEGTGGKERDQSQNNALTAYDRAKTFYWATQKKNSKTKAQEGADYFATPEPLGFKMVEWLGLRGGEDALEPSGGHGAIARWLPDSVQRTVIEPSPALRSRLAMVMDLGNDRIIDGTFEELANVNKFDGIVMNPPFGVGGKMAIEHLAKAAAHLRDGGRIVALIPTGPAADKRFEKWMNGEETREVKPLIEHPTLGPIYRGDTVESRATWAPSGVVVRANRDGGLWVKVPGRAGETTLSNESITGIAAQGPRSEIYRPADGLHQVAEIRLPQVTFERAGTAVATRIVVIDKHRDPTRAPNPRSPIDLTGISDIRELFDRLEDMSLPARAMTSDQKASAEQVEQPKPADQAAEAGQTQAEAQPAAGQVAPQGPTIAANGRKVVKHVTQKGKTIHGIVAKDITKEQAQEIDPYTFKKDGGWFIREKHVKSGDAAPKFSRASTTPLPDTITIDGVERPTTNSKGQPIHPTEAGVRKFWEWFAGSKVVDEQGRPLVMYHATNENFSEFKPSSWSGDLIYFANSAKGAKQGARGKKRVMEVYVRMESPLNTPDSAMHWTKAQSAGGGRLWGNALSDHPENDGLYVRDEAGVSVAVTRPTQIKSATGNTGAFDAQSPDIRFSNSPDAPTPAGITAESLPGIFAQRFPKLAGAIKTMLDRGALGQKGGLVVLDTNDETQIAREFADRTGRTFDETVQMFESGVGPEINGFYDALSGTTFLVGPNLDGDTASAVVMHEMTHGQQRQSLDEKALAMINDRAKAPRALGQFLTRVAQRMEDVDESGNASEATAYIVEMAVQEGRQAGFSAADGPILAWIEKNIGKPVADLVREFVAMARAWALAHGVDLKRITVDDLVAYAKLGLKRAADGRVVTFGRESGNIAAMSEREGVAGKQAPTPSDSPGVKFSRAAQAALGPLSAAQQSTVERIFGKPKTLRERAEAFAKDWQKNLVQGIFDQFAPIKELTSKGYMLARLAKGSDSTLEAMLVYGKVSVDADGVYKVDFDGKNLNGFAKTMAKLDGEHDRFLAWVSGQRAERLSGVGLENLMTPADIAALQSLADGNTKSGKVRRALYADALKDLNAFNDSVLKIASDSGLIDEATREMYRDVPYVPFYRLSEEDVVQGPSVSKGLVNQSAWKRLKGGTNQLNEDLMGNLLKNWSHLITASANNRAAKEVLDTAARMGAATDMTNDVVAQDINGQPIYRGNTKGLVRYRGEIKRKIPKGQPYIENGQTLISDGTAEISYVGDRYFKVDDPHLMDAISSIGFTTKVWKPMADFKRYLTFGVTVNPTFKIRNLIRDSIQAVGTAELSYNPVQNILMGAKGTAMMSNVRAQMLASGGMMRFGSAEGGYSGHVRRLIEKGIDPQYILDDDNKIKAFWKHKVLPAFEAYQELGDRSENVNRAALYEQMIKKGMSHAEASFWARDMMDFSMHGKWAAVRTLTSVVPFMNARLQGIYKLGRATKADYRRMGATLAAVSMASIGLMLAYGDDDDWKKREDWERDGSWWFKVGGVAFVIPKPFEVGAIGTIAERSLELMISDEMTGKRFGERMRDLLMHNLSMNPTPQLIKPMIDLYANKDGFSGRDIETQGMEKLRPEDRYTNRTSEVARFLGQIGLPNPAQLLMGRVEGLSPVQIDHLIRGYFAWVGTSATTALDYGIRPMMDRGDRPDMRLKDVFLVGNFVQSLPSGSSRYVTQFYAQAKEIEQMYASYQQAIKEGNTEKAQEIRADNAEGFAARRRIESAKRAQSLISGQMRTIERSKEMSGEEKRARLDQLEKQRDRLARQALLVAAAPGRD